MILTARELASVFGLTKRGFAKLVHNMNIPHTQFKNRFLFDLECLTFPDFWESIKLSILNPKLRPLYSIDELCVLLEKKSKTTIRTFLIEKDIKTYQNGRKTIILLADILKLKNNK